MGSRQRGKGMEKRPPGGAACRRSGLPLSGAARSSFIRCNGNLAVIDCRGRLAAQRDSVVADDIDAREWVLLIDPAAVPPRPHSRSLRFWIILWRCWAAIEHGITRSRSHDLR